MDGLDKGALRRFGADGRGGLRPLTPGAKAQAGRAEGRLAYAVGDLHGRYDLLRELLETIAADAERRAGGRRPALILLGDYVDRGPDSAKVLEALVWLRRRSDLEVCLLKGNHEEAMLRFLDDPVGGGPWLRFGGAATLESYGVTAPDPDLDAPALLAARDALLDAMPASHLRLLQSLELMAVLGDYAFVHAGVEPGTPLAKQREQDLLWIRGDFIGAPGPFEKVVVHGHTWVDDRAQRLKHRIGLDTGAYKTGVLSALRIEDAGVEVLQVRDPQSTWRPPGPPPWTPVAQPADYTRPAPEHRLPLEPLQVLRAPRPARVLELI